MRNQLKLSDMNSEIQLRSKLGRVEFVLIFLLKSKSNPSQLKDSSPFPIDKVGQA